MGFLFLVILPPVVLGRHAVLQADRFKYLQRQMLWPFRSLFAKMQQSHVVLEAAVTTREGHIAFHLRRNSPIIVERLRSSTSNQHRYITVSLWRHL
jgi:hypothetical protein